MARLLRRPFFVANRLGSTYFTRNMAQSNNEAFKLGQVFNVTGKVTITIYATTASETNT